MDFWLAFLRRVKTWIYVLQLRFFGIRFCEREVKDAEYIKTISVCVDGDFTATFKFYRKTMIDLLYLRDTIKAMEFSSYYIEAEFGEDAPPVFKALGCRTVLFNGGTNRFSIDEKELLRLLTDIYLDFLRVYLERWKDTNPEVFNYETRFK